MRRVIDATDVTRTDPPLRGDEAAMLRGYLDFHRDTLRLKCAGLTQEQLAQTHAPSTLTLGGLMKHLALVEHHWFSTMTFDRPLPQPFTDIDWDADPEWEFRTAADDSPEELRALFDEAVRVSDAAIDEALADGGLDRESDRASRREGEGRFSTRWVLIHMIEEYSRHNGHADLLRESIDGQTGE